MQHDGYVLTPDVDGMSWLSAYLPEAEAARVYRRLSAEAQALATDHNNQDLDGEPRTADQIRADLLVDQLLAHPGTQTCSGPSVTSPTGGPGAHRESVAKGPAVRHLRGDRPGNPVRPGPESGRDPRHGADSGRRRPRVGR